MILDIYMCVYQLFIIFFNEVSIQIFCPFLNFFFFFAFFLSCKNFLNILGKSLLSDICMYVYMLLLLSRVQLFSIPWFPSTRLLYPWNFPGKNTGVVSYSLLQEIFLTRNWTLVSCMTGLFCILWAAREARTFCKYYLLFLMVNAFCV